MFSAMLDAIKLEVVQVLCRLQLQAPPEMPDSLSRTRTSSSSSTRRSRVSAPVRRRRPSADAGPRREEAVRAARSQGRSQRPLSLWIGQEVQALPRQAAIARRHGCAGRSTGHERRSAGQSDCATAAAAGIRYQGRDDLVLIEIGRRWQLCRGVYPQCLLCGAGHGRTRAPRQGAGALSADQFRQCQCRHRGARSARHARDLSPAGRHGGLRHEPGAAVFDRRDR